MALNKYTIFMKKLLGVDILYLDSQKKLKNLMNHFKYNKVLTDLVSGNKKPGPRTDPGKEKLC